MRKIFCLGAKKRLLRQGRKVPCSALLVPWFFVSILAAADSAEALDFADSTTLSLAGGQLYSLSVTQDANCVLQAKFADPASPAGEISGAPFGFPYPTPFSSPNLLEYGLFLGGDPAGLRTVLLSQSQSGDKELSLRLYAVGFGLAACLTSGGMAPTAALETLLFRHAYAEGGTLRFLRADLAATTSTALISDAVLRSAVDAQANLAVVYDLMLQKGLNGYDGKGGGVFVLVDYRPSTSGCNSPTAISIGNALLFSPPGRYRLPWIPPLVCSEANYENSYASLLDVFAHEYAHVVTRSHIDLLYQGESGALDEAFADWTGVALKLAAGGGLDWQFAEGLRGGLEASLAGGRISPLRDLQDPGRFSDPARIGDAHWRNPNENQCNSNNDYCYVHSNNGVPNHMFYRLSTGLKTTETISGGGLDVQGRDVDLILAPFDGLGVTRAFAVGLYAATNLWQREETFMQAADHMRVAAMMIYGAQSCEVDVVARSWAYVGVPLEPEEAVSAGERLSCLAEAASAGERLSCPAEVASAGERLSCPAVGARPPQVSFFGVLRPKSLEVLLWLFAVLAASRLGDSRLCV